MCMCVTDMYCHVQAPTIKRNIRSHVPLYSGQQLQHQHAEPPRTLAARGKQAAHQHSSCQGAPPCQQHNTQAQAKRSTSGNHQARQSFAPALAGHLMCRLSQSLQAYALGAA